MGCRRTKFKLFGLDGVLGNVVSLPHAGIQYVWSIAGAFSVYNSLSHAGAGSR